MPVLADSMASFGIITFFVVALVVIFFVLQSLRGDGVAPDQLMAMRIADDRGSDDTFQSHRLSQARMHLITVIRNGHRGFIRRTGPGLWEVRSGANLSVILPKSGSADGAGSTTVFVLPAGPPRIEDSRQEEPQVAHPAPTPTSTPLPQTLTQSAASSVSVVTPKVYDGYRAHPQSTIDVAAVSEGATIQRFPTFEAAALARTTAVVADPAVANRHLIVAGGENDPVFYLVTIAAVSGRSIGSIIVPGGVGSVVHEPLHASSAPTAQTLRTGGA